MYTIPLRFGNDVFGPRHVTERLTKKVLSEVLYEVRQQKKDAKVNLAKKKKKRT